jgi:hypothetical protein
LAASFILDGASVSFLAPELVDRSLRGFSASSHAGSNLTAFSDVAVDDAEQRDDHGLVGGDRVEVAHLSGNMAQTPQAV